MEVLLEGSKFFNFIENNIDNNPSVIREFVNLDIRMTIGTTDLDTFISVNRPSTTVTQEKPEFTNITNGIGLFTARNIYYIYGIGLNPDTRAHLLTLDRNFILP